MHRSTLQIWKLFASARGQNHGSSLVFGPQVEWPHLSLQYGKVIFYRQDANACSGSLCKAEYAKHMTFKRPFFPAFR